MNRMLSAFDEQSQQPETTFKGKTFFMLINFQFLFHSFKNIKIVTIPSSVENKENAH